MRLQDFYINTKSHSCQIWRIILAIIILFRSTSISNQPYMLRLTSTCMLFDSILIIFWLLSDFILTSIISFCTIHFKSAITHFTLNFHSFSPSVVHVNSREMGFWCVYIPWKCVSTIFCLSLLRYLVCSPNSLLSQTLWKDPYNVG